MTKSNKRKNAPKPAKTPRAKSMTRLTAKDLKPAEKPTKLTRLVTKLTRPEGATISELAAVTGWQHHSVRGALAGSLKRKGYVVTSSKVNGIRRYSIGAAQ